MAGSVLAVLVSLPLVGTEYPAHHDQNEIQLLTPTGFLMEGEIAANTSAEGDSAGELFRKRYLKAPIPAVATTGF